MADDMMEQAKEDVEKFRKIRQAGSGGVSITKKMEGVFWTGAIFSVIGMLAVMPWVGPTKAISGELWLVASLGGIVLFSSLAFIMRQMPEIGT